MNLSASIDLERSLRQVLGENADSEGQVAANNARQTCTAEVILERFFGEDEIQRRELVLLADEVGLGKTYVALAVAVTILDQIRQGQAPQDIPANKPVVLILTPNNEALYNKWLREAETFKRDCARAGDTLDWLRIERPLENSSKSGNLLDLTISIRKATRSKPVLLIAKASALGAALYDRDWWRRRALACVFGNLSIGTEDRPWWCRQVLGSGAQKFVPELLDLRGAKALWTEPCDHSPDLQDAYQRALVNPAGLRDRLASAVTQRDGPWFADLIDELTREALAGDWPTLPLIIIDEIHGLKNRTQARHHLERYLGERACRVLGLSATPFQLRHDELLSVLGLRCLARLSRPRSECLEGAVSRLAEAMQVARGAGDQFRRHWCALRPRDRAPVQVAWDILKDLPEAQQEEHLRQVRPARVAHALEGAVALEVANRRLQEELRPVVIRHRHQRSYREHFVGQGAEVGSGPGNPHFAWAPGMEVRGNAELAHYLMMRSGPGQGREGAAVPGGGTNRQLPPPDRNVRRLAAAGPGEEPAAAEVSHSLGRDAAHPGGGRRTPEGASDRSAGTGVLPPGPEDAHLLRLHQDGGGHTRRGEGRH